MWGSCQHAVEKRCLERPGLRGQNVSVLGIHTRTCTHKEAGTTSLWFKSVFSLACSPETIPHIIRDQWHEKFTWWWEREGEREGNTYVCSLIPYTTHLLSSTLSTAETCFVDRLKSADNLCLTKIVIILTFLKKFVGRLLFRLYYTATRYVQGQVQILDKDSHQ